MRTINKRTKRNRVKAHRIIVRFLRNGWDKISGRYINCDFSEFRRNRRFTSLLYHEQDGLCCYCMRSLDLNRKGLLTLEHIMPLNVADTDVAFYYSHIPNLRRHVRRLKIATDTPRLAKLSPFPHFCAYENLVLSCSGAIYTSDNPDNDYIRNLHECCNNARGNDRILPMYFDGKNTFVYNDDGTMDFPPQYEQSIRVLKLESNDNLRLIRKTWSELMRLYTVADVERAIENSGLRKNMLEDTILDYNEVRRMMNKKYWQLLYDYRWFGTYYHNRR